MTMTISEEQLSIVGITIDVIRKDIKNMHLAVYPPTGRVRIAAPLRVSTDAIRLFAISKLRWIRKHQKSFEEQAREPKRLYITGESHYFKGKRYQVNIVPHKGAAKVVIRNKRYIDFYTKESSSAKQRERVFKQWYRQALKKEIPPLIKKWEKKMKLTVQDWGVKQMRTKWGTCNIEAKRIWLNLELIKKPIHCLEYIIVHEMVHFLERHHNDRFVVHMDNFLPKWRSIRKELNHLPIGYWEGLDVDS